MHQINQAMVLILFFVVFSNVKSIGDISLELYPTFNNIGVTKYSNEEVDQCSVIVCKKNQNSLLQDTCYEGHPLDKVAERGKFVGSIFWLNSNTQYQITVTCGDDVDTATVATRKELTVPSKSNGMIKKTLYVSTDGTSTDCSSEASPCNLNTVMNITLSPGTEILFKEGTYHGGMYEIDSRSSGTAENPIIFRPLVDSGKVIFDGSTVYEPNLFTNLGNGVHRLDIEATVSIENLVLSNKTSGEKTRLIKYYTLTKLEAMGLTGFGGVKNMGYYIDKTNNYLYINIGDDKLIDEFDLIRNTEQRFLLLMADFVYFHDLSFYYYGNYDYISAIDLKNSNYGWFKNCVFDHNFRAIALKYQSEGWLIEENTFKDSKYHFDWDGVKEWDGDGLAECGQVWISSNDPDGTSIAGRGLILRRNLFTDLFDGFNIIPNLPYGMGYYDCPTNEIDVYENEISYCRDDGFELDSIDGFSSNVRVYNNNLHHVYIGISLAPVYPGPVFVINNTITNLVGWSGLKFTYGVSTPSSGIGYIYHNSVVLNTWGYGLSIRFPWEKIIFRNNIFFGYTMGINVEVKDRSTLSIDYCSTMRQNGGTMYSLDGTTMKQEEFFNKTGYQEHGVVIYKHEMYDVYPFFDEVNYFFNYSSESGKSLFEVGEHIKGINYQKPNIGSINLLKLEQSIPEVNQIKDEVVSYTILGIVLFTLVILSVFILLVVIIAIVCIVGIKSKKKNIDIEM